MSGRKQAAPAHAGVGRGCVDCAAYELPMQKKPCLGCRNWNGWTPSQKYLEMMALRVTIEAEITNRRKKK